MCFAVPWKVKEVFATHIILENGKTVACDPAFSLTKGSYVRLSGPCIVDTMTEQEGDAIVELLKRLSIDQTVEIQNTTEI